MVDRNESCPETRADRDFVELELIRDKWRLLICFNAFEYGFKSLSIKKSLYPLKFKLLMTIILNPSIKFKTTLRFKILGPSTVQNWLSFELFYGLVIKYEQFLRL